MLLSPLVPSLPRSIVVVVNAAAATAVTTAAITAAITDAAAVTAAAAITAAALRGATPKRTIGGDPSNIFTFVTASGWLLGCHRPTLGRTIRSD